MVLELKGFFEIFSGKPRHVEVKLKCKKSESASAVSIYLLEPKTCEYVLGVESPLGNFGYGISGATKLYFKSPTDPLVNGCSRAAPMGQPQILSIQKSLLSKRC